MSFDRRNFMKAGLSGMMAASFRAAAIGVPVQFLLNGTVLAADGPPKFTLIASSDRGESMNCSAPGAFPTRASDPQSIIERPALNQVGANITRRINGNELNANDIAQSVSLRLGDNNILGARAYRSLPQSFLNHLVSFWHRTGANAHPEMVDVLKSQGAIKNLSGPGAEQLPAAIAQEMHANLGTAVASPFVLQGRLSAAGIPLNQYNPTAIKQLLLEGVDIGVSAADFSRLYNSTIDGFYKEIKSNGSAAQKRFLDQHVSSRQQALTLGDELGSLLGNVVADDQENQVRAALALFKVNLAPVVVMEHTFSGDNHGDRNLRDEVESSLDAINMLNTYWQLVQEYGLRDRVTYATINVFGRNARRNGRGGRNHAGNFTTGFIHGTHLKGGVVGGLETSNNNRLLLARGINHNTGGVANPTISATNTLAAYSKTMMSAAGISEARCNARIPDSRIVTSIFNA